MDPSALETLKMIKGLNEARGESTPMWYTKSSQSGDDTDRPAGKPVPARSLEDEHYTMQLPAWYNASSQQEDAEPADLIDASPKPQPEDLMAASPKTQPEDLMAASPVTQPEDLPDGSPQILPADPVTDSLAIPPQIQAARSPRTHSGDLMVGSLKTPPMNQLSSSSRQIYQPITEPISPASDHLLSPANQGQMDHSEQYSPASSSVSSDWGICISPHVAVTSAQVSSDQMNETVERLSSDSGLSISPTLKKTAAGDQYTAMAKPTHPKEQPMDVQDQEETEQNFIAATAANTENNQRWQDPDTKPPFSYIALISMALAAAENNRLRVAQIYEFIMQRFPFYRSNLTRWQNSIRHNLSINDCFIKRDMNTGRPNPKGKMWAMHPDCGEMFNTGSFVRRARTFRGAPPVLPVLPPPPPPPPQPPIRLYKGAAYAGVTSCVQNPQDWMQDAGGMHHSCQQYGGSPPQYQVFQYQGSPQHRGGAQHAGGADYSGYMKDPGHYGKIVASSTNAKESRYSPYKQATKSSSLGAPLVGSGQGVPSYNTQGMAGTAYNTQGMAGTSYNSQGMAAMSRNMQGMAGRLNNAQDMACTSYNTPGVAGTQFHQQASYDATSNFTDSAACAYGSSKADAASAYRGNNNRACAYGNSTNSNGAYNQHGASNSNGTSNPYSASNSIVTSDSNETSNNRAGAYGNSSNSNPYGTS